MAKMETNTLVDPPFSRDFRVLRLKMKTKIEALKQLNQYSTQEAINTRKEILNQFLEDIDKVRK